LEIYNTKTGNSKIKLREPQKIKEITFVLLNSKTKLIGYKEFCSTKTGRLKARSQTKSTSGLRSMEVRKKKLTN